MNRAGLKPSAAITRGMTDTQAAIVNSRWFRHSAAGVSPAATALTRRLQRRGRPRRPAAATAGNSAAGRPRAVRRAAVVRAPPLARSEVGHRFPSSWLT